MAALQSRALAVAGYDVLQIDLLGCGDSSGDFSDACWQAWKDDVVLAYDWLRTQTQAPLTLWGLRAGCMLAANAAVELPEKTNFIFWQPVVSGKQHWQQFIRLKIAGELSSGLAKGIGERLKQQLASGNQVEIAGYMISPALVREMECAELFPPAGKRGELAWFELTQREDACLAPVSQKCIEKWHAAGYRINARIVRGPAFWQTTEIEDAPELIAATLAGFEARA